MALEQKIIDKLPEHLRKDQEFLDLWEKVEKGEEQVPPPIWELINEGILPIPSCLRQPCEVYSRVMGYFRPVASWNIGKKSEFADRKESPVYQTLHKTCCSD